MKRTTLFLATIIVCCVSVAAQPNPDLVLDNGVAPHAGIDAVYRRFSDGYRKLDPASVASLYTEGALYLAPGQNIDRGRKKILENFTSFFNSVRSGGGSIEISFRIVDRRVSG
ncbi:MAG TPA: hypothetical protein VNA22_02335, partial [Pyrinomonadaceae bacterium]|nr:hypothetical protein [Pyrinomonadaceae bacterium]